MPELPKTDWEHAAAFVFWGGDRDRILSDLGAAGAEVCLLGAPGAARGVWLLGESDADKGRALSARRLIDGGDLGFDFELWSEEELIIERAAVGLFQASPPTHDVISALTAAKFRQAEDDPMLFERADGWLSVDVSFGRAYLERDDIGAGIEFETAAELVERVEELLADDEEMLEASEETEKQADEEHEDLLYKTAERIRKAGGDVGVLLAAMMLFEAGEARIGALTGTKLSAREHLETLVLDEDSLATRMSLDVPTRTRLARLFLATHANLPTRL